jgi:hypothetical protein
MKTTIKIAGSLLAFGLVAGNALAELPVGLNIKTKQMNRWGTLEGDANFSTAAYDAKGYALELEVQPMKEYPFAISLEGGFSTTDGRNAKISNASVKDNKEFNTAKLPTCEGNYNFEETLMLSTWAPSSLTGSSLLKPKLSVGYSLGQVNNVYGANKTEEEKAKLKEGETTTTTKNVSGSNNGFVARIANEAQITENVSFEIAYDFGMRKLNLESEKGGPTMTENKKDGSSKKVLFKDTRDNNTHTVSVSFNVNI